MEARSFIDEERLATLEKALAEAQVIAEDADRRYDEVSRRLAIMEVDLERTEDRAEAAETYAIYKNIKFKFFLIIFV